MTAPVVCAVPTSPGREDMLLGRALPSIYAQVDALPVHVLVVADRDVPADDPLHERIAACRRAFLGLRRDRVSPDAFPTTLIENRRTRGRSLTGSINTAADEIAARWGEALWLATLDDDDAWHPTCLAACLKAAGGPPGAVRLVAGGYRHLTNKGVLVIMPPADLHVDHFLAGSPGLTGSNLFVALSAFRAIGGYDEGMPSTTDRDLYIRLLDHFGDAPGSVAHIGAALVDHFADGHARVTNDREGKHRGLDLFYAKYRHRMSPRVWAYSIARAKKVFDYEPGP